MNIMQLLDDYTIEIPALQRNYVHGEDTARAKEVREHFLTEFCSVVRDPKKKFDLNFVYGTREDEKFIPVDGQQRLTTLWLLATFLVHRNPGGAANDSRADWIKRLSKFTYVGRPLAEVAAKSLAVGATRAQLVASGLCRDATCAAMVGTLETIEKYECQQEFKKDFCDLEKALERVVFEFQDIFQGAEKTYIKMNARGKTLTQWENFKGKFASCLISDKDCKDFKSKEYFEREIEKLSDKYFEVFTDIPDTAFFSLFGRIADYVLRTGEDYEKYETNAHENLSILAKGVDCYVPVEEFSLENIASRIIAPVLRMLRWALNLDKDVKLWYWEGGEKSESVAKTLLVPKNDNDRDFALFLFECFTMNEGGCGLCKDSYRALRLVANILENVDRESPMRPSEEKEKYNPKRQFNRIEHLKRLLENSDNLYDAQYEFSASDPMQLNEEFAKGKAYRNWNPEQIQLLQACESYMRGRVRIALLAADNQKGKWTSIAEREQQQSRLATLKGRLEVWHSSDEQRRIDLLRHVIRCEPWNISDQITLSTKDDTLRDLLSTRDDVYLQKTCLDGCMAAWERKSPWQRDWRENVFDVNDDWKGRAVKWHGGTDIYFLYAKDRANVTSAMPVADWRFDLQASIRKAFAELGKVESVSSNDGGTRSFKCEWAEVSDSSINIYLWKDSVEIRWFNYDGNTQRSERIEIKCDKEDGLRLACKIKEIIMHMKAERP